MSNSIRRTGQEGEEAVACHLAQLGWTIVERNCRQPSGEIDIIAEDGTCLVVVEVKTRRSSTFGSPFEAVDRRKQRRIAAAALEYLAAHNVANRPVRFDVAAVYLEKKSFKIELLHNAFEYEELCNL